MSDRLLVISLVGLVACFAHANYDNNAALSVCCVRLVVVVVFAVRASVGFAVVFGLCCWEVAEKQPESANDDERIDNDPASWPHYFAGLR